MNEILLCDSAYGYQLLDTLAQANVDLRDITLEQAKSLLVETIREDRLRSRLMSA